jgi:CheY-like chemotaxis protein
VNNRNYTDMPKHGPILLIEDDVDDHELFIEAIKRLGVKNEVLWFQNPVEAKAFLMGTSQQPFIIFCDINMPVQNGIDFKRELDEDQRLREKSVPFVFYSTSANISELRAAYTEMTVQGFFQKPSDYNKMKETLSAILTYWQLCRHPNE